VQCPDSLVPLVVSSPKHADCLQTKKNELEKLEFKLDTGHLHSLIHTDIRYSEYPLDRWEIKYGKVFT
jgi:hypothetical protein